MSLYPKQETVNSGVVVFQKVLETARGGFTLDISNLAEGQVIPAGTPIGFDESTRLAKPLKVAELYENAANNATTYKIKKGHLLKTGENVGAAKGGAAYAITGAIDTSNAAYDVITLGTTLGVALTAGSSLFQSSATGATAAALSVAPNGLLYEDTTATKGASLSVVLRGTVYARRIPALGSDVKTLLPLIIFSQSF